jgi:hypothetical protein
MGLLKSKRLDMKGMHIMKRILFIAYITLCYNVCLGQTLNGHEYVDLGLPSGTKWATCNIGATIPEEYGDYFAWGETSPKTEYSIDNYKYWKYEEEYEYEPSIYLLKYNIDCDGVKDNKKELEPTDDAASVNWGKGWRMPTKKEFDELYKYCTCMEATSNGVKGQLIVGPNNNYIFLPNAGYYWSKTLYDRKDDYRYDYTNKAWINGDKYEYRYHGLSVRPVCNVTSNTSGYKTLYNLQCNIPSVSTKDANSISSNSAISGGVISTTDDCSEIIERGVCWTKDKRECPSVLYGKNSNVTKDGGGTGDFSSNINMLSRVTTYRVRAYAVISFPNNIIGTIYGQLISFTTAAKLPILSCKPVYSISQTAAMCKCDIVDNGGERISECGFCWSKTKNPTINDSNIKVAYLSYDKFSCQISGLDPGTTYYLKAYAKNGAGIAYSLTETFRTKGIDEVSQLPSVSSLIINNVTADEASVSGSITSSGGVDIIESGICLSTSPKPTSKYNGSGINCNIKHLKPSTTYYVRAYATNSLGTTYGEECCFTTASGLGNKNGHEYVDLGLSVNWATCNVGASTPEEYGDYFAWGETATKENYDWSTYRYCNGSRNTITKYCDNQTYGSNGYTDNLKILEVGDDAATINWGGSWRMPTEAEMLELKEDCTWTWITHNNVGGFKITGPNGNYIFLPAGGYYKGTAHKDVGSICFYLSNSLTWAPDFGNPADCADGLYLSEAYLSEAMTRFLYWSSRCYGYTIRPVCIK